MKNLKIIIFYCFLIGLFNSCEYINRPEPIDNYRGNIIYLKAETKAGNYFTLRMKGSDNKFYFKNVYVLDYDFNRYKIKDTIK